MSDPCGFFPRHEGDQVIRVIAPEIAAALWGERDAAKLHTGKRRQARNIAANIKKALAEAGHLRGSDWIVSGELEAKDVADHLNGCHWQNDPMEKGMADAFDRAGIKFSHESQRKRDSVRLDFYVGEGVYVEVKRMHTPRVEKQLASAENVILVQGKGALDWLSRHLASPSGIAGERVL